MHCFGQQLELRKGPAFQPIPSILEPCRVGLFSGFRRWHDRNKLTAFETLVKFYISFDYSKNRVIFTHAYACAWPEFCSALAYDDVAWNNILPTI